MSDSLPSGNGDLGDGNDGWCDALPVDDRLDLLASGRRRTVLRHLQSRQQTPVRTDELVDHLTSAGHGERKTLEISLHHVHLPKLASKGVVEYDTDRDYVWYQPHPALEELLAFVDEG